MPNYQFGRLEATDSRDKLYTVRMRRKSRRKLMTWDSRGWHGDQGDTSQCVGYGFAHWLAAAPFKQFLDPAGIYKLAQYFDSWPGQDYEGTSVRGGAKVLSMLGMIARYEWTWSAQVVANHILTKSPVVLGVNWYEGMLAPGYSGDLKLTGEVVGGHCVCAVGYNTTNKKFLIKNSWGRSWGRNGYAYLKMGGLQRLLNEQGEACVGIEQVPKGN